MTRTRIVALTTLAGLLVPGVALAGTWSVGVASNARGTSAADALQAPGTGSIGTAAATSLPLSWPAPAAGATPSGYIVARSTTSGGTFTAIASGTCSGTITITSCTDTGLSSGTPYYYKVRAVKASNWTGPLNAEFTGTTSTAVNHAFTITGVPTNAVAGTGYSVTITSADSTYNGTKSLTWTGGQTIGTFSDALPTSAIFSAGSTSGTITFYKAGARSLTVKDSSDATYAGSASTTVATATPTLAFSACTNNAISVTKNTNFSTTVTRTGSDPYGNSTGTAAATVNLSPFDANNSNNNFTTAQLTFAVGGLVTGSVNYETANGTGASTLTGAATGYTSATCTVTTTN
jgi:hypothetical protein